MNRENYTYNILKINFCDVILKYFNELRKDSDDVSQGLAKKMGRGRNVVQNPIFKQFNVRLKENFQYQTKLT